MHRIVHIFIVLLLAASTAAIAQTGQDSTVVALKPCLVFPAHIVAGNTTTNFKVRGLCNVPVEATAVFAQVIVTSTALTGKGYGHLWAFATTAPTIAQFCYSPDTNANANSRALVALCDPEPECGTADVSLRTTTAAAVAISVEGYLKPLPLP